MDRLYNRNGNEKGRRIRKAKITWREIDKTWDNQRQLSHAIYGSCFNLKSQLYRYPGYSKLERFLIYHPQRLG